MPTSLENILGMHPAPSNLCSLEKRMCPRLQPATESCLAKKARSKEQLLQVSTLHHWGIPGWSFYRNPALRGEEGCQTTGGGEGLEVSAADSRLPWVKENHFPQDS